MQPENYNNDWTPEQIEGYRRATELDRAASPDGKTGWERLLEREHRRRALLAKTEAGERPVTRAVVSETLAERRRVVAYLRAEAHRLSRHRRWLAALLMVNLANRVAQGEHLHG